MIDDREFPVPPDLDFAEFEGDDRNIIREAKARFHYTLTYEGIARKNFNIDYKLAHADSINGFQWPDEVRQDRDRNAKPWLTINKIRQHNLMIINELKKRRPAAKTMPAGGDASYQASVAMNAILKWVDYNSSAGDNYMLSVDHMVTSGWGYWRVMTDYVSDRSDEQDFFIRPVKDPLSVLQDPDISQMDGSDQNFCIIFSDYPMKEFRRMYPQYKGEAPPRGTLGDEPQSSWFCEDKVRVAEYFRRVERERTLITYSNSNGKNSIFRDEITEEILQELQKEKDTYIKERVVRQKEVEWFYIVGEKVVERRRLPGKYIPIVRLVAEEYLINGRVDRPGHTRALADPQRMYNYWATAATEYAALQTKVPWLAAWESIEDQVEVWASSHVKNPAYLPYRAFNEDGQALPPPQKITPPMNAPAYASGMQQARDDMSMVSGQYASMMGEPSNDRTGASIRPKQRQGDTATFHYTYALGSAIAFTGKIILDWMPFTYDTPRLIQGMSPDGKQLQIQVDPMAQQHFQQMQQGAEMLLNPMRGMYSVYADIGPDWVTQREETLAALTTLVTQSPAIAAAVPDLLIKCADFELADEAAERLRRTVPPNVLGEGPSPAEQQLQQQLQLLSGENEALKESAVKAVEESAKLRVLLRGLQADKTVDVFDAETKRMSAMSKMLSPEDLAPLVHQLVQEALATNLKDSLDAAAPSQTQAAESSPFSNPSLLPQNNQGGGGANGGSGMGGPGQGGQ